MATLSCFSLYISDREDFIVLCSLTVDFLNFWGDGSRI